MTQSTDKKDKITLRKVVAIVLATNLVTVSGALMLYDSYFGQKTARISVVRLSDKNLEMLEQQRRKVARLGTEWISYKRPEDRKALEEQRSIYKKMSDKASRAIANKAVYLINNNLADVVLASDSVIAAKDKYIVEIK